MKDLIERLEGLTGPCRECDALIGVALAWFKVEPNKGWPEKNDYVDIRGGQIVYPGNGFDQLVPAFTASIDAAMTLVPDGFRICNFSQHDHKILRERGEWMCSLYPDGKIDDSNRNFDWPRCDHAPTPAIALCIAALKAAQ